MFGVCMRKGVRLGAYGTGEPMSIADYADGGGDGKGKKIFQLRSDDIKALTRKTIINTAGYHIVAELEERTPILMELELDEDSENNNADVMQCMPGFTSKAKHLRIGKHIRRMMKKLCH